MYKRIYFVEKITETIFNDLHKVCKEIQPDEHLQLCINSTGGSTYAAIGMYNYLKSLPCKIATHNLGEVTSGAILIYLAGSIRTAETHAKFMIHPIAMLLNGDFSLVKLQEITDGLIADITAYADIVNRETNSLNSLYDVKSILHGQGSIVLNPSLAYKCGIVTNLQEN